MKGVSPLVATALLIVITISIAAILANFVSTYTRQTLQTFPTCIGGSVVYATTDYPKWDSTNNRIIAAVEAHNVPLGAFSFDIQFTNSTVSSVLDTGNLALKPGSTGTILSPNLGANANTLISQARVSTNCSNVKTDFSVLR